MARVIGRVPIRAPRRKTTWGAVNSLTYTNLGAGVAVILADFSAASLANLGPSILIRVRGMISVVSDQTASAEKGMGAFGVAVVNEAARVAGVGSVLTPITDAASDGFQTWQGLFVPSGVITGPQTPILYEIDSKGQRKLGDLDSIVLTAENASASLGMQIAVQLRFLFLLH